MRIEVAPEVFEAYPDYRRYVLVARGVDNNGESPELESLLRMEETRVREASELEDYKAYPRIAVWRSVFADMGLNANKYPPSIANLVKRTRAGKDLPFISKLVAIFNVISLRHIIPCGGDSLSVVEGDVRLGRAKGNETYAPLGRPEAVENPEPGEIVLMDTGNGSVFCRGWCWKNGDPSKIMPETDFVAINVDCMRSSMSAAEHTRAAHELAELVVKHCGGVVDIHLLEPGKNGFDVEGA